ncbi:MAG: hypothetical protein ACREE1_08695, partial [Stellaceae bacterium]
PPDWSWAEEERLRWHHRKQRRIKQIAAIMGREWIDVFRHVSMKPRSRTAVRHLIAGILLPTGAPSQ